MHHAQGAIFVERSHLLWKAADALDLLARGATAAADLAEAGSGSGGASASGSGAAAGAGAAGGV